MRHFDMAGTPYFMSPEAVSGRDVDHHSDVWSFAGFLLQMVTGRAPFQALRYRSREALWRHIVDPRRESPLAVEQRLFPESESGVFARHDSCALEAFLRPCFEYNPTIRPSAVELLRHPWLIEEQSHSSKTATTVTTVSTTSPNTSIVHSAGSNSNVGITTEPLIDTLLLSPMESKVAIANSHDSENSSGFSNECHDADILTEHLSSPTSRGVIGRIHRTTSTESAYDDHKEAMGQLQDAITAISSREKKHKKKRNSDQTRIQAHDRAVARSGSDLVESHAREASQVANQERTPPPKNHGDDTKAAEHRQTRNPQTMHHPRKNPFNSKQQKTKASTNPANEIEEGK